MSKPQWRPVDWIVAILAITVAQFVIGMLVARFFGVKTIDTESVEAVDSIMSSLISLLSLYVGASIQKRIDRNEKEK